MAPLAAEPFWKLLDKSEIISREKVKSLQGEFQEQRAAFDSAGKIVDELVNRKVLTKWQADKLLQGKHKGFLLGPYRILDMLGEGGMGTVFLAEHRMMRRLCAIKVLPPKQCNDDPSLIKRFYREAQAVAALDHPNIVRAYDVSKATLNETEVHYLVMEYVGGKDLQRLVDSEGVLGYRDAARFIRQVAEGLSHAHERGFVHRDVKPANVLVDSSGTVKILDLGLARFFDPASGPSLSAEHGENLLGTADYLAPEQAVNSHTVDARADIYSLGQTGYFLLTGHAPFPTGTIAERLMAHQVKSPEPIERERPDVPPALLAIIERMTAKKPEFRYQSVKEVAEALDKWLSQEPKEHDLQGFAARFQKQLHPSQPASHQPTRRASAATEETDLELAPLEDEESPPKTGSKSGSSGRKAPSASGSKPGSSGRKVPSSSGGKPASKSGARKTPVPDAKDTPDPLDDLALSSPQIDLTRASHLDSSGAHPTVSAAQQSYGATLPARPKRKRGLEAAIGSPLFWIGLAALVILVLIIAIVIALSSSQPPVAPPPTTPAPTEPEEPPAGTPMPPPQIAPPEPTADEIQPPGPSPPQKPASDEQATAVPKPPDHQPKVVPPKPPEDSGKTPPEKPTPPTVEKPKKVDPKVLFAGVSEFSYELVSFDPNPRSKFHVRVHREMEEAAGRADLTISETKGTVMAITLSTSEKDGMVQFMISAALKCGDPADVKAPAITVWQHEQELGVAANQLLKKKGIPVSIFAPNITKFFTRFVDDYEKVMTE